MKNGKKKKKPLSVGSGESPEERSAGKPRLREKKTCSFVLLLLSRKERKRDARHIHPIR